VRTEGTAIDIASAEDTGYLTDLGATDVVAPLAEAAEALADTKGRHTRGKTALVMP
jgi:hypothetical protein